MPRSCERCSQVPRRPGKSRPTFNLPVSEHLIVAPLARQLAGPAWLGSNGGISGHCKSHPGLRRDRRVIGPVLAPSGHTAPRGAAETPHSGRHAIAGGSCSRTSCLQSGQCAGWRSADRLVPGLWHHSCVDSPAHPLHRERARRKNRTEQRVHP